VRGVALGRSWRPNFSRPLCHTDPDGRPFGLNRSGAKLNLRRAASTEAAARICGKHWRELGADSGLADFNGDMVFHRPAAERGAA
jgi:hypothetical protein